MTAPTSVRKIDRTITPDRLLKNTWEYRGIQFSINPNVPANTWGRYSSTSLIISHGVDLCSADEHKMLYLIDCHHEKQKWKSSKKIVLK